MLSLVTSCLELCVLSLRYLNRIGKHPVLRKDEYFREFLENPSDVSPFPSSFPDGSTHPRNEDGTIPFTLPGIKT